MEYNTQRGHLNIAEYGRNIQKMVNAAVEIEDRNERTRAAHMIVSVMSQLNPGVKDSVDYQNTLWDHMFIISGFRLDVDGPFPPPSQEDLTRKPDRLTYTDGRIRFRHYGKNIENIIEKAKAFEEGEEKEALVLTIANHLKKSYLNWNRDSVADDTILAHLEDMSDGQLTVKEGDKLVTTPDVLSRNKPKKKKVTTSRGKDSGGRRRR